MKPLLAFHQGAGLISTLIKWQTRGEYSHASILVPINDPATLTAGYRFIESREGIGVRSLPCLEPAKGDKFIDLFEIDCDLPNLKHGTDWLFNQVDKKYDYGSVLRFVSRRQQSRTGSGKWFCSELAYAFVAECGLDLFRATEPWEVHPSFLSRSPFLKRLVRIDRDQFHRIPEIVRSLHGDTAANPS